MTNVIEVENLSKKYILDPRGSGGNYLRESLSKLPRQLWAYGKRLFGTHSELQESSATLADPKEFWALRDVSFSVKAGERIGIIGRNGAGKSTLLKILARVVEPTSGQVRIKGRVSSLLEVGTGFHQDLTGRENVYLSGAILGLDRQTVRQKFDEIVEFSGTEAFLDMPVKRYSSGMYVRLAFSVAAHLHPDILLIDEVLAVGDLEFKTKCKIWLKDLHAAGLTFIYIGHDLLLTEEFCPQAKLLEGGRLINSGNTRQVLNEFIKLQHERVAMRTRPQEDMIIRLLQPGAADETICPGKAASIEIKVENLPILSNARIGVGIHNSLGKRVLTFHTDFHLGKPIEVRNRLSCVIYWPEVNLCPGAYYLRLALSGESDWQRVWEEAKWFKVGFLDYFGTGVLPDSSFQGDVLARAEWNFG